MIRRWWAWRRELTALRSAERRLWRRYAAAHTTYAEAVEQYGYPAALPEAEDVQRTADECRKAARARRRHEKADW